MAELPVTAKAFMARRMTMTRRGRRSSCTSLVIGVGYRTGARSSSRSCQDTCSTAAWCRTRLPRR
ncbi:hypothetical protein ACP4OV_022437 [Aristida adscensionis]